MFFSHAECTSAHSAGPKHARESPNDRQFNLQKTNFPLSWIKQARVFQIVSVLLSLHMFSYMVCCKSLC
jgi:hypothetical protein